MVRWLPIQFIFNRANSLVRWMDFGTKYLTEPFFHMTLECLRGSSTPAPEKVTSIDLFLEAANATPTIVPSAVIFHVSRCGSTLLTRVLKAGEPVVALSEAPVLDPFFEPFPFGGGPYLAATSTSARKAFLDGLIRIYAHWGAASDAKVLIKANFSGIFGMSRIRQVWPTVPFVILIRDPVEVIVSNLNEPVGWFIDRIHSCEFGWTLKEGQDMPPEEYLARFCGRLCQEALTHCDDKCYIIDYSMLGKQGLSTIADFLGIDIGGVCIEDILKKHARHPSNSKAFEADTERKQRQATPLVRDSARKWADEPYSQLKALAARQLATRTCQR